MPALPAHISLDSIETSNMAPAQKSAIRRWYDNMKGGGGALQRAKLHAVSAGHGLRSGGEALAVGAGLAALHSSMKTGLDVPAGGHMIPIDAIVGALGIAGSIAAPAEPASVDLRNAGSTAMGIFAFRKVLDLMATAKLKKGTPINQFNTVGTGATVSFSPGPDGKKHPVLSRVGPASVFVGEPGSGQWGNDGSDHGAEDPIITAARFL